MLSLGGFIVGLGIGGVATFLVNKGLRDRVRELEIQNEDLIAENRKHAHRGPRGRERGLKTPSKEDIKITNPFEKEDESFDRVERERKERDTQVKVDYVKLSQQYRSEDFDKHFADRVGPTDDEPDEDGDLDDDDEGEGSDISVTECEPTGDPNGEIRMISSKEFSDDLPYRENETLIYYQEDDVLTTTKNEVIKDQESKIGAECMGMICETDEEFLYIDNEVEDKLYDIVINHDDSFYRDIMSSPSNYDRD